MPAGKLFAPQNLDCILTFSAEVCTKLCVAASCGRCLPQVVGHLRCDHTSCLNSSNLGPFLAWFTHDSIELYYWSVSNADLQLAANKVVHLSKMVCVSEPLLNLKPPLSSLHQSKSFYPLLLLSCNKFSRLLGYCVAELRLYHMCLPPRKSGFLLPAFNLQPRRSLYSACM